MIFHILFACQDVKPASTDDTSVEEVDTAIEEETTSFEPVLFTMNAMFGVENNTLKGFMINETWIQPYVQLLFLNDDSSQACSVFAFLPEDEIVLSDWRFEDLTDNANPVEIQQQGFYLPDVQRLTILTSDGCDDWNESTHGLLSDHVDHAWGVAFGGGLRADLVLAADEAPSDSRLRFLLDNDYLIGGSWSSDLWEPAAWASHAFTVSPHADWVVDVDADGYPTALYTAQEVEQGISSGVYTMIPFYFWDYHTFF